jgi:hypothetical protein
MYSGDWRTFTDAEGRPRPAIPVTVIVIVLGVPPHVWHTEIPAPNMREGAIVVAQSIR